MLQKQEKKEIEKFQWIKTVTTIVFPNIKVSFFEQNYLILLFNKKEVLLLNPKVMSVRKWFERLINGYPPSNILL